uniref:Neurotransmitter-gated ion-channel ligand-binding domain-containing protein n=1 Tax=Plectus sambesii TaxID=2011161 RepID=A0A914W5A1_9BILA
MVWLLDLRHVSFFCYTFIILAASNVFANELDVYEAITANYNKNVRPVRNFSEPVVVSVELVYFNLLGMIWKDEYIGWNASEVGGTAAVVIPYDLLWKPDIYVSTGLSVEYKMPDEQRFVNVLSDGTVRLLKPCLITNRCALSIEAFPYDVQTCNIILDSWMYSTDQVDLVVGKKRRNMNSTINDGYFVGNGEWTLVSFDKALELTNASSGRQFPDVTYTVKLRRQPIYYICVLLIPTFVTATICLFGLFVPAMNTGERVEKVNMGLATLLSMAIILGIVAGEMPKTTTLPLLGFYVLAELILCTIGIIVSMVIMVVHQRASTRVLIPPRWLNTILFLKMKSLQEPEKTDVTTGDTEKVSQPLSKDKAMIDLFENIKNSIFAQRLNQVLDRVEEHIDDKEFEDYILLQWIIIFDRIDMLFLVLFNTVNIVMPIILFKY